MSEAASELEEEKKKGSTGGPRGARVCGTDNRESCVRLVGFASLWGKVVVSGRVRFHDDAGKLRSVL